MALWKTSPFEVRPVLCQVDRRAEEVRTPGRPVPGVRRVAIARHDRLGDLVLTLPTIDALRRAYPSAEVALLVSTAARPLAERVPGVDRVHAIGPGSRGLTGWLRQFRPDLAVCVSRSPGPAWAAWRAGVPCRVGTGRRWWSVLFDRRVDERRRAGERHEVEYALSFAHRAGAPPDAPRFPLSIEAAAGARVDAWLRAHGVGAGFVLLVPGSGGSCPRWPARNHVALAERLRSSGVPLVLNTPPCDAIDRGAFTGVAAFDGDVADLVALVDRAALVIGSSTAPVHVAAARGTPALAIHAPWSSCGVRRWGPYHERGWAIVAECDAARRWGPGERRRRGGDLLAAVGPDVVFRAARAILDGAPPRL
jgi:ADP-heptose:LPS heptosyltransferase